MTRQTPFLAVTTDEEHSGTDVKGWQQMKMINK